MINLIDKNLYIYTIKYSTLINLLTKQLTMRQLKLLLVFFTVALMVSVNLMAQESTRHRSSQDMEKLNAKAKNLQAVQQTSSSQDNDMLLDFCIPGGDCSWDDGFTDFAFAGIENYDSGCSPDGYGDFTSMQGTAEIGNTYTATFATGYANNWVSLWIDIDDDSVFSDYERILTDFVLDEAGVMYNVDITIPGFCLPGVHRMRAGSAWAEPSSPDPCAFLDYGEWEDYMIEITGTPVNLNASAVSIDMAPVMLTGDVTPKATVANMGVQTISFPVTMTEATTAYSSTVQVTDLAMGESVQIEFDTWTVDVGTYTLEACTDLTDDEVPEDDCESMVVVFSSQPRQKLVADFFTGTW